MRLRQRVLQKGMWLGCFLFVNVCMVAQTTEPAAGITLQQLVDSAKVYFRDSTEFPMTQKMTFTLFDSSGRVREVKHQVLDYVFNGYNRGTKTAHGSVRGNISMWAALRGAKMIKVAMNNVFWTWLPGR